MNDMSVRILGTRGSVPVSGGEYARYGGATTCVTVTLGGTTAVLDAGTGILSLPAEALEQPKLALLLTHPHADHLLGLPMCPYLMLPGRRLDIYAAVRDGRDAEAQVRRLISPPLWPIGPEQFPAELVFHSLEGPLELGGLRVDAVEGVHPGGVSVLRLRGGGRTVVVATDCTLTEALRPRLLDFARDCDLLLCDGQYSPEEWPARAGFGHNCWEDAARFARDCGAKAARIVHHDPTHGDGVLDAASRQLREIYPLCGFAREGERIAL